MERDPKRQKKDQSTKREQGTSEMSQESTPMDVPDPAATRPDDGQPRPPPSPAHNDHVGQLDKTIAKLEGEIEALRKEIKRLEDHQNALRWFNMSYWFPGGIQTRINFIEQQVLQKEKRLTLQEEKKEAQGSKRQRMDDGGAGDASDQPPKLQDIKFKKAKFPSTQRKMVVDREPAMNAINDYVVAVISKDGRAQSSSGKGTKIFSTTGISGTGKTELLLKACRDMDGRELAVPTSPNIPPKSAPTEAGKRSCDTLSVNVTGSCGEEAVSASTTTSSSTSTPASTNRKVQCVFCTFNSSKPIPVKYQPKAHGDEFGLGLLYSAGCPPNVLHDFITKKRSISIREAVEVIRKNFNMGVEDVLVVFVDELGRMASKDMCASVLNNSMQAVDSTLNDGTPNLVMVFSALLSYDVATWRGITGREIVPGCELHTLTYDNTLKALNAELEFDLSEFLKKDIHISRLLKECSGHARATFDFFLPQVRQWYLSCVPPPCNGRMVSQADYIQGCSTVFTKIHVAELQEVLLLKVFNPNDTLSEEERRSAYTQGFMIEGTASPLPILIRVWAQKNATLSKLAEHLHALYSSDHLAGYFSEKFAEDVFLRWELVRRISAGKDFSCMNLDDLYPRADRGWNPSGSIYVHPPGKPYKAPRIVPVQNLMDDDILSEVLIDLKAGNFVVSNHPTEKAIEFLMPLWKDADGDKPPTLVVLGAQVKMETTGSGFAELSRQIQEKFTNSPLGDCEIVSLIFTTHDATKHPAPSNCIGYSLSGLEQDMGALGPLRLLTEKKKTK